MRNKDNIVPFSKPVAFPKRGKVVCTVRKGAFDNIDCSRIDQKKMRSCIQDGSEKLTDYEKLRAENIKRNFIFFSTLGIPEIGSIQEKKKAAKSQKVRSHDVVVSSVLEVLCWSCKNKLGSPSSLFCGQCGKRQTGPQSIDCSKEDLNKGCEESTEVEDQEVDEGIEVLDTLLTYERVFHPRRGRLPTCKLTLGKKFLKAHHPRQHKKLNLNHKDVRQWFSDMNDEFISDFFKHPSIRHDPEMMKRLTEFVKAREPELVTLLFIEQGISLHWKVDDIIRYAIEIKHYRKKLM